MTIRASYAARRSAHSHRCFHFKSTHPMHSKILILDFGSQVTQLIARRVRDSGVFSEVFPYDVSDEFVRNYGAAGVILSGSHSSTLEGDAPRAPDAVFELACRCWASATACRPWP